MPTTKKQLEEALEQVAQDVEDLLDPTLTREELVRKIQDLDTSLNSTDDDSDDDESDPEDDTEE